MSDPVTDLGPTPFTREILDRVERIRGMEINKNPGSVAQILAEILDIQETMARRMGEIERRVEDLG